VCLVECLLLCGVLACKCRQVGWETQLPNALHEPWRQCFVTILLTDLRCCCCCCCCCCCRCSGGEELSIPGDYQQVMEGVEPW
jgi:hypothetical protein